MTVYLIGPSGVGKTTCARTASRVLPVKHIDIDSLCLRNAYDWSACRLVLAGLEDPIDDPWILNLIDIGAGTQTLPELRDYLLKRREHVVLVWAPESEVIQRNPLGPERSRDEYHLTEYANRQQLYAIAPHRINVEGVDGAEAGRVLADFLLRTFIDLPGGSATSPPVF